MTDRKQSEIDIQQLPKALKEVLVESTQYCIEKNIHAVTPNVMTVILLQKETVQNELKKHQMNFGEVIKGIDYYLTHNYTTKVDINEDNVTFDMQTSKIITSLLLNQTFTEEGLKIKQWDVLCEIKDMEGTFLNQILSQDEETAKKARQIFRNQVQQQEDLDEEVEELLKNFTVDYTELAREGNLDPVIGRDVEIHEITEVLARKKKNNVVLLGNPGTGKTSIIEGIALAIVNETAPDVILDKSVVSIDTAGLLAGTKYRGEFEERCRKIFDVITERGNVILFIDEAHTVMGAGASSSGGVDLANMMKPKLARGQLSCIMATTKEEYRQTIQKDGAMVRRLQTYTINEPTDEHMIDILTGLVPVYEKYHQVEFKVDMPTVALTLGKRYMQTKANPDKSIDILDSIGAYCRVNKIHEVTMDEVMTVVSRMANVPAETMSENESTVLRTLAEKMKKKVFNQDEPIDTIIDELIISKAGLKDDNKPMGAFLVVGTSGTGKTHTSKELAKNLGIPLIKYDMSEYQESHSVSKLIGSPPGYVGYEENSAKLVDDIADNPNCVLLLDEVEKAHPKVLTVLLQIMDDATLTSSSGKVAKFNNVIMIMTSNLGARSANRETIGFNAKKSGVGDIKKAVEGFFPPEFINRLNAIFTFNNLDRDTMLKIVERETDTLNDKLKERNISVTMTDHAKQWLATEGFDETMGARPLQRLFSEQIKKDVSKKIVLESLPAGSVIQVDVIDDKLVVNTSVMKIATETLTEA